MSRTEPQQTTTELPFLSIVMPVRNEEAHIAECLGSVLAQDYPKERIEIFVADGMSTDRTREIVSEYQTRHPNIRLVDNPERIVPTGLNRAIRMARGDVIVRVDGHAIFAPDFLHQNVAILAERPDVWSCGGPIVHIAHSKFGRAVAAAMSHPIGVGNATHRIANYEGYAEGAQFPALRKWVFDKIGMFDERLVRNQDDEFNYRIALAGGKVYISPRVKYRYFVRERPSQLFKQYFQYGYWRIPVMKKHRRPTTLRQIAPPLFFLAMGLLVAAGLIMSAPLVAAALPVSYVSVLLAASVLFLPDHGVSVAVRVPLALGIMHSAYGLGILFGLVSAVLHPRAWEIDNSMSSISR